MTLSVLSVMKYLMVFLMLLYTVGSFSILFQEESLRLRPAFFRQIGFVFLFHLTGFGTLLIKNPSLYLFGIYTGQLIFMILYIGVFRILYPNSSRVILSHMFMFLAISFIMLTRLDESKALRQFVMMTMGGIVSLLVPKLFERVKIAGKLALSSGILGMILLLLVLLLSTKTYGANLSLSFFGVSFQPSEFVKISFVLLIAYTFKNRKNMTAVLISAVIAMLHVLVLVWSTDLGGALIYAFAYLFMLYAATAQIGYLITGSAAFSLAAVLAYRLFSHVRVRVEIWQDPWAFFKTTGNQICNSLLGIANGGLMGTGLLNGRPNFIPVVEKDFMFSAVSEELGGIIALCVIFMCVSCFLKFLIVSAKMYLPFHRLIGVGLSTIYIVQVFLTIGGNIKFIPATGVTLPLVSYGGSSIISTFILFGIMQALFIKRKNEKVRSKEEDGEETIDRHGENRPIYLLAAMMTILLLSATGYFGYLLTGGRDAILGNVNNNRFDAGNSRVLRGDIESSDGVVLSETIYDEEGEQKRHYPHGALFSEITGYVDMGKTGLEQVMNRDLLTADIPLKERIINDLTEQNNPGNTVVTTINSSLQYFIYQEMGDRRGAVLVSDPRTGEILSMVSKPSVDPNTIAENWDEIIAPENDDGSLMNRCFQGLYSPGSTFKILTAIEYMRENPDTYKDYTYECTGSVTYDDMTVSCSDGAVHGEVDLVSAMGYSCNCAFIDMGLSLDREKFAELLEEFGFSKKPWDLLPSKPGSHSVSKEMTDAEMIQVAFGQGRTMVTPMFMHQITCMIANQGIMMEPKILDRVVNVQGDVVKVFSESQKGEFLSEEETEFLTECLKEVVYHGTSPQAQSQYCTVAGKTGSAQFSSSVDQTHAWFTGFAPAEAPEIAVTIILEKAGHGAEAAAPIFSGIVDFYYENMR